MVDALLPRRHRLLLVEDDENVRNSLAELLAAEGFEVECAGDGDEGLAILRGHASFDLILLDLMLPGKDGWEFRVAQRADPVLSTIPVIAMSADRSARASAIDADAYVSKPFKAQAMVATLRSVLDQRRLMHLDRLASLGRMAAGIAHEVNNPLTYVYASLVLGQDILTATSARMDPEASAALSNAGAAVEKAIHGVERMRSIMSGLRSFIRAPDDQRVSVDVRTVIETSLAIVGHEIEHKATLEKHLGQVPLMRGNPGQLGQLIVNLFTNAADSIAPGDPGAHRVIVRTSTSEDGEIVIEVVDTGCGMSEAVRGKIFEPFFSTRPPGLGTGLGLSICHGIVRGHDGTIGVQSAPGEGTSFRVVFPPVLAPPVPSTLTKATHERRLLIIEDHEHVADALALILRADYDATLVVGDGDKAMDLLEDDGATFETILCDMHLGRTTGKQIYERLCERRPELAKRIVFMTGAAFSGPIRQFLDDCPNPCLMKPFNRNEFREAVAALPLRMRKTSGTQMKAVTLQAGEELESSKRGRPRRA